MRAHTLCIMLAAATLAGAASTVVFLTRDAWLDYVLRTKPEETKKPKGEHDHAHGDRVEISEQAQKNLRLKVEQIKLDTYWRILRVPGVIVERRGRSDHTVTTPVAGVITQVLALPGEALAPATPLLVLRPNSESLQSSQTELLKAVQEKKLLQERYDRLAATGGGVIPEARLQELKGQIDRLESIRKAQRIDLATRGLTPAQMDEVEKGTFLDQITIRTPAGTSSATSAITFEVEELKVKVGEQVPAGQVVCLLGNHLDLAIEGHGFKGDTPLLEKAAEKGWPITVEVAGETGGPWKQLPEELVIEYMANALDPGSQTFPFYLSLPNQFREYRRGGRTYRVWEHRPGQRVQLGVRVEKMDRVFILPAEAVVREGPEAYVFQQSGDEFIRRPIHVRLEDHASVVAENDGSIVEDAWIAHNGAAALNRALKAKQEVGGGHDHHGHSH